MTIYAILKSVSKMTRLEACLRSMIAKKSQMRGFLSQRDFRVRHKQQQQKTITKQPFLTNKLNRRNMYRRGDNAFQDINTITLRNFHLLIPRMLRDLFCLHSKVPQSEKAGFHSLGPQNLSFFLIIIIII